MSDGLSSVSENYSDAWLRSTAAAFGVVAIDASEPRRVYLDRDCEIFCLVSPQRYAWVTQWRWGWRWDRTKTKRYATRTSWRDGRRRGKVSSPGAGNPGDDIYRRRQPATGPP